MTKKKVPQAIESEGNSAYGLLQELTESDRHSEAMRALKANTDAHLAKNLPKSLRASSETKEVQSAFKFGRAYQAAVQKGALSDPINANQVKTAVAVIKRELDSLKETLSENKISDLIKKLLVN